MNAYHALEVVVLAGALAISAWMMFGKFAPRSRARMQALIARRLDRPGAAAWRRRLAQRLEPRVESACGSGCNACGSCGSTSPSRDDGLDSASSHRSTAGLPSRSAASASSPSGMASNDTARANRTHRVHWHARHRSSER